MPKKYKFPATGICGIKKKRKDLKSLLSILSLETHLVHFSAKPLLPQKRPMTMPIQLFQGHGGDLGAAGVGSVIVSILKIYRRKNIVFSRFSLLQPLFNSRSLFVTFVEKADREEWLQIKRKSRDSLKESFSLVVWSSFLGRKRICCQTAGVIARFPDFKGCFFRRDAYLF